MKRLLPLTDDQRAQLLQRYKTQKNVRLRDRLQCVLLKADGRTNREVAAILHTSEHTINDWLDRYEMGGLEGLCAWETGGSEAWLSPAQLERLKVEADTHAFQSAKQACAWVEEQFGISYSDRGMRDLLKRLGYTHQKARLVPEQANPERQAAFFSGVPTEPADTL